MSGARGYQELCIAAKNEEKRLADLRKRQEYSKLHPTPTASPQRPQGRPKQPASTTESRSQKNTSGSTGNSQGSPNPGFKCLYCDKPGHRKEDCRKRKKDLAANPESRGPSQPATTKQISTNKYGMSSTSPDQTCPTPRGSAEPTSSCTNSGSMRRDSEQLSPDELSPVGLLFSDSEEEGVTQIRVMDGGSRCQLARAMVYRLMVLSTLLQISPFVWEVVCSSCFYCQTQEEKLEEARQGA